MFERGRWLALNWQAATGAMARRPRIKASMPSVRLRRVFGAGGRLAP